MRLPGKLQARGVSLFLTVLVVAALALVVRLYTRHVLRSLGPTLIARAERALQREIRVDQMSLDRAGRLVLEGLRVARGRTMADGVLVSARRVELEYRPELLSLPSILARGRGRDTRATLRASGVRLSQPAPLPPDELLSLDGATVDLDLSPILLGSGDPAGAIRRVSIERPRLQLSRGRDNRWNLQDLLPEKTDRPSAFRGEVQVTGAVLDVVDHRSGRLPAPVRSRLLADFTLHFAAMPRVRFAASGLLQGGHGGALRAAGHYDADAGAGLASIRAEIGSLSYWDRYLRDASAGVEVLGGSAVVDGTVWAAGKRAGPPGYRLSVAASDWAFRAAALPRPVDRFRGTLSLTPSLITLAGDARSGGAPFRMAGQVTPLTGGASLRLDSDRLTIGDIRGFLPAGTLPAGVTAARPAAATLLVTGAGRRWNLRGEARLDGLSTASGRAEGLRAALRGRLDAGRFAGEGSLSAARLRIQEVAGRGLRADFRVRGGVLQASGTVGVLGGKANADAWIDLKRSPPVFYVKGRAERLQSGLLPVRSEAVKIAGPVTAVFSASGTTEEPDARAYFRAAPVRVNGELLQEVEARLRYSGGVLEIPLAVVRDPRASLSASGRVTRDGELQLRVSARGVDLEKLVPKDAGFAASGRLFLEGSISGTTAAPAADARVQIYQPVVQSVAADYLEGNVTSAGYNDVQVSALKLIMAPVEVTAPLVSFRREDGESAWWSVEGELEAGGLTVPRALLLSGMTPEALRKTPLAGEFEKARVSISGPLLGPDVRFDLAAVRCAAAGSDLGRVSARGSLRLDRGLLILDEAAVLSPLGTGSIGGALIFDPTARGDEFARSAQADFRFQARGLELQEVVQALDPKLRLAGRITGRVETLSGWAGGTLAALRGEVGPIGVRDLELNAVPVALEPFSASWRPEGVVVRGVRARVGEGGEIAAPFLALALPEPGKAPAELLARVAGELDLRAVPLPLLVRLLRNSPYYYTDEARALREAVGRWGEPEGGALTLSARLADGPPVTAALSAAEILAAVRAARPPAGLRAELRVGALAPPAAWRQPALDFRASLAYRSGRLDVAELALDQAGGARLRAAGFQETRGRSSRLEYDGEAEGVSLELLQRLPLGLGERLAPLQPLRGRASLRLAVRGTMDAPEARFGLEVTRPEAAGLALERLTLTDGEFAGGRLRIGRAELLAGPEPGSGRVAVAGSLPLGGPAAPESSGQPRPDPGPLDLTLTADDVPLRLVEQLRDPGIRKRLGSLRPLAGALSLRARLGGTTDAPSAAFSLDLREPVVAGVSVDRLIVEGGDYRAAAGRLALGEVRATRQVEGEPAPAQVRLSGYLPLRWPELSVPRDGARELTVEVPEQSLGFVPALAEDASRLAAQLGGQAPAQVARASALLDRVVITGGSVRGRVLLAGTADRPDNSGSLSLGCRLLQLRAVDENGSAPALPRPAASPAEPALLQTAVQELRVELVLRGSLLEVREFSGTGTHGGAVTGGGRVALGLDPSAGRAPRLALTLSLDRFRVSEKQAGVLLGRRFAGTRLAGELSTVVAGAPTQPAPISVSGQWPSLAVNGAVVLHDAALPLPGGEVPPPAEKALPEEVSLNLRLLAGRDVWIESGLARLKLEGALQVANSLREPVVTGEITVPNGSIALPLLALRNVRGRILVTLDTREHELGIPARPPVFVELTASSTLRLQQAGAVEPEYYDATFTIRGSPGGPAESGIRAVGLDRGLSIGSETGLIVTITTDPPLPGQEIEALIRQRLAVEGFGAGGANVVEALRGQIEQALAVNVASAVTGRVEDALRSAFGLDVVSLDVGVTQPLRVRIGKRLFGRFYGSMTQQFGGSSDGLERRLEMYFRVNPQIRVGVRQEEPIGRRVFFFSGTFSY